MHGVVFARPLCAAAEDLLAMKTMQRANAWIYEMKKGKNIRSIIIFRDSFVTKKLLGGIINCLDQTLLHQMIYEKTLL